MHTTTFSPSLSPRGQALLNCSGSLLVLPDIPVGLRKDTLLLLFGKSIPEKMHPEEALTLSSTNWRVRPSTPLALLPYLASLYSTPTLHPNREPGIHKKRLFPSAFTAIK